MKSTCYRSFDEMPVMLSITQVAAMLGISHTRAYELSHTKDFPALTVGTPIVVPQKMLLDWLGKQSPGSCPLDFEEGNCWRSCGQIWI